MGRFRMASIRGLSFALLLVTVPVLGGEALSGPTEAEPLDNVLSYLGSQKAALGLSSLDVVDLATTDRYVSKHNGVTHLYVQQRVDGVPVANRISNFNIAEDGRIMSFGNQLVADLASKVSSLAPAILPEAALARGAGHFGLMQTKSTPVVLETVGGLTQKTMLSDPAISRADIPVELAYYEVAPGQLRLTWQLTLDLPDNSFTGNLWIDAEDATVLAEANWITFDSYNVYALPKESPSDGPRTIEVNSADPIASPFGWHDTNGVAGAEFTTTRGNNVIAQEDQDANDSGGFRPDGGPLLDFNFPLDLALQPTTYVSASVTNLFYINNIVHDILVQYGFDEASGNMQQTNYSGAPGGTDAVRADALDGSGFNNANFSTPPDGSVFTPRMQMFQWKPPIDALTTVNAPPAIAGGYQSSTGDFGPQLDATGPVTGNVELVTDTGGAGTTTDGCEALVGFTVGNVALIDRGSCDFSSKVLNAQNAGAIAVIVANDQPGILHMGAGAGAGAVNIPSVLVTQTDGNTIKTGLGSGVNAILDLDPTAPVRRDSDLDNGIIAHEYGHGLSNRLVGGPSQTTCLNNDEQPGEGWSDWLALILTAIPADGPTTSRGIGTYVSFEPSNGPGIRNFPYTTNLLVNPQTYADISTTNIPHGVGEIWASTLWEMYWRLVLRDGFDADLYAGTGGNNLALQLSIDGMKMTPCRPGFVQARDAILAADNLNYNDSNRCVIWKAFAKRGVGESASQGVIGFNGNGVGDEVEAFDIPLDCQGLVLTDPFPGVAGVENAFHLTGATPGDRVYLVAGRQATSTTINVGHCGAVNFGVGPDLFKYGVTDGSKLGDGKITRNIPASLSGGTAHFQLLDLTSCTTSNVVSFTFP